MSPKKKHIKKNCLDIRQELANNLSIILNTDGVNEKTKINAINYAIYNWTEANGKYEGNEFWSFEAYENYCYVKNRANQLVHEHIVPRKIIRDKVMELPSKDALSLYLLFDQFVIAAVITKEEDDLFRQLYDGQKLVSKMPLEFTDEQNSIYYNNPWARYLKVNSQNPEEAIDIRKITNWKGRKEEVLPSEFLGPSKDVMEAMET